MSRIVYCVPYGLCAMRLAGIQFATRDLPAPAESGQ